MTIVRELTDKRTSNSKTYLKLDGSYEAHIFSGAVHFEDVDGNLYNIETKLFDGADLDSIDFPVCKDKAAEFGAQQANVRALKGKGTLDRNLHDFHALKTPFNAIISRNFKRGYSLGKGEDKLKFIPVGASPSLGQPCNDMPDAIEYQDVWNDVDACLQLTDKGIKETLTAKTSQAPSVFTFEVEGNLAEDLTAGALKIAPAWLEDAAGTKRDVSQTIRTVDGVTYIDLEADYSGLVYPVKVDPTVTIQPDGTTGKDASITNAAPTSNLNADYLYIGFYGTGDLRRSFYQPDISSIPAGSTVTSAVLTLVCIGGHTGSTGVINAYRVTSSWGETTVTWNTPPTDTGVIEASLTVPYNLISGAYSMTLTNLVNSWVNGIYTNNGITFRNGDESNLGAERWFTSSDGLNATDRPKLVVTYNQPPTAPTVTAPNGGETWNAQHTITWNAATDSDNTQASLQYQIQKTTDNGASWSDIVALTTAGATSYIYDFSSVPESSICKVRVRAYDGTNYGAWDESNGVFTIQHNQAPLAPTNLSPVGGGYNKGQTIRFSWQHNDPNTSDPQSKFDLQWRLAGSGSWNTVTQVTTNQYYDMLGNTLPAGSIEWQVRTYDQQNLSGAYSSQVTFTTGDTPTTPTITSPANNSTVSIARPAVQWSSVGQAGYQLQLLNSSNAVIYDSGDVASTNKAQTLGIDLINNTTNTIKLRVRNSISIWSDWATSAITVSFTPPAIPTITAAAQSDGINISFVNPTPTGTEPTVNSVDLFRREAGGVWTRITAGLLVSSSYKDYNVSSGVSYDYYVRAYGNNGTYRDSLTASNTINLSGLYLHDADDPAGTVLNFLYVPEKAEDWEAEAVSLEFAGRKNPVTEFGEQEKQSVKAKVKIIDNNIWNSLQSLVKSKATICLRDPRGRKLFGVIRSLPETDEIFGQEVGITLDVNYYTEEV